MPSLTPIRHGQSIYNLANLFTGNIDVTLTALGETAGKTIKAFIYNVPIPPRS
jgi:2,3-bisphosphoglycerate-dependent phosphoglycerate mutase